MSSRRMTRRKAYRATRKASGKSYYVPSSLIKRRGKSGRKNKVLPQLKQGELTKYGYSFDKNMKSRRRSLKKKVKKESRKAGSKVKAINKAIKQLNVQKVYRKHMRDRKSRSIVKKVKSDLKYLRTLKKE
jgi:hypothetical protein